jgi:hypothetical protein
VAASSIKSKNSYGKLSPGGISPSSNTRKATRPRRAQRADETDAEYKLSIEAGERHTVDGHTSSQSATMQPLARKLGAPRGPGMPGYRDSIFGGTQQTLASSDGSDSPYITSLSGSSWDQDDQSRIPERVAKRLGLSKDEDRKVSLTSLSPGGGKASTAKLVVPGSDDIQPAPSEASAERSTGTMTIVYSLGDNVAFKRKISGSETDEHEWIRGSVVKVIGEGKNRRYEVKDLNPHNSDAIYKSSASQMTPIHVSTSIDHITNSRAASERRQDHYDEDDNRSSSSST